VLNLLRIRAPAQGIARKPLNDVAAHCKTAKEASIRHHWNQDLLEFIHKLKRVHKHHRFLQSRKTTAQSTQRANPRPRHIACVQAQMPIGRMAKLYKLPPARKWQMRSKDVVNVAACLYRCCSCIICICRSKEAISHHRPGNAQHPTHLSLRTLSSHSSMTLVWLLRGATRRAP